MVIQIYKSTELKGYQQEVMVCDCKNNWQRLNFENYFSYHHIMNIKTRIYYFKISSYVTTSYHFNLNKW